MKKTLTTYEAAELLFADDYANWTRAGAFALCEYLEDLESDTGEEIDFCPVSIRCDFAEYASLENWADDYWTDCYWKPDSKIIGDLGLGKDYNASDVLCAIRDFIRDRGILLEFNGGIIVSNF